MRQLLCLLLLLPLGFATPLAAESLFRAETLADGTLYSDQVARQPGDLLTIRVSETTSVSEKQETSHERVNDASAAIRVFPGSTRLPASEGGDNAGTLPAFGLGSNKSFEGESEFTASGRMTATVTARVIDVLDNGNLVIEGRRTIRIHNDSKTIILTGICRTADIGDDNTIQSEKLHNFQVGLEGEGPLTRAQQEGWLGRLLNVIWPF